ncbi:hypothetical protein VN23_19595 [Janthinobacterium sp. B9-8]|nr:hypothetical protein VN23_19595 [Janthinobacterium sp. B9-8]
MTLRYVSEISHYGISHVNSPICSPIVNPTKNTLTIQKNYILPQQTIDVVQQKKHNHMNFIKKYKKTQHRKATYISKIVVIKKYNCSNYHKKIDIFDTKASPYRVNLITSH